MKLTDASRRILTSRREYRDMNAMGYKKHETDWEIHRGGMHDHVIVDAKISACGKYVWTLLGKKGPSP